MVFTHICYFLRGLAMPLNSGLLNIQVLNRSVLGAGCETTTHTSSSLIKVGFSGKAPPHAQHSKYSAAKGFVANDQLSKRMTYSRSKIKLHNSNLQFHSSVIH
jgi:hypothetical protein